MMWSGSHNPLSALRLPTVIANPSSPVTSSGGFDVQLRGVLRFEDLPDYDALAARISR